MLYDTDLRQKTRVVSPDFPGLYKKVMKILKEKCTAGVQVPKTSKGTSGEEDRKLFVLLGGYSMSYEMKVEKKDKKHCCTAKLGVDDKYDFTVARSSANYSYTETVKANLLVTTVNMEITFDIKVLDGVIMQCKDKLKGETPPPTYFPRKMEWTEYFEVPIDSGKGDK